MNKSPDALPLLFCCSLSIRRPQKISANKTKSLFCPNIQLMIILPVIEKPPVKPEKTVIQTKHSTPVIQFSNCYFHALFCTPVFSQKQDFHPYGLHCDDMGTKIAFLKAWHLQQMHLEQMYVLHASCCLSKPIAYNRHS